MNTKIGNYDYKGLVDFWLKNYKDIEYKETAGGRMSFRYEKLYSYNTVIATIIENKKKEKAIFLNIRRYSNTTSKHRKTVMFNAIYPIVKSSMQNGGFKPRDYIEDMKFFLSKFKRARAERMKKHWKNEIKDAISNMKIVAYYTDKEIELTDKEKDILFTSMLTAGK